MTIMVTTLIVFASAPAALAVRIGGHVNYNGGPAPGSSTNAVNLPVLVESGENIVALTHTGPNGNFHIDLAPGRYTLVPLFRYLPHSRCTARAVTVRRGALAFFVLGCPEK
jgi:hypothetical protein